jgi:hypothetical protein
MFAAVIVEKESGQLATFCDLHFVRLTDVLSLAFLMM